MTKSEALLQTRVMMYKTVVQTLIMYGSESWVVMGEMFMVLKGFNHLVAKQFVGNTTWRAGDGG